MIKYALETQIKPSVFTTGLLRTFNKLRNLFPKSERGERETGELESAAPLWHTCLLLPGDGEFVSHICLTYNPVSGPHIHPVYSNFFVSYHFL